MTLIGHREALEWLRAAVQHDRLAHAYLLTGPRGVGRRTFALEIASALNCLAAEVQERPDHTCQQCRMIERGVHPDVRAVRRAPERRAILMRAPSPAGPQREYADNVEFIQSDAQLRPVMGRKKLYIILNAEELAQDAADRLLKTIEEPPPFVVFLLTAVERGAVFPTIASRCQEIRLRPAARPELTAALVERGLLEGRAAQLSALAGGRQGVALVAAQDEKAVEREQTYVRQLLSAVSGSRLERLLIARALSDRWSSQPETVRETLRAWMTWCRDVVLVQLGLSDRVAHLDAADAEGLMAVARQLSPEGAREATDRLRQTLADLDANVNPRLAIDLLLLKLPSAVA